MLYTSNNMPNVELRDSGGNRDVFHNNNARSLDDGSYWCLICTSGHPRNGAMTTAPFLELFALKLIPEHLNINLDVFTGFHPLAYTLWADHISWCQRQLAQ
jgi:hypothetical protein